MAGKNDGSSKKRLGRGLNALLGAAEDEPAASIPDDAAARDLVHVPVGQIERNPYQPRQDFDDENLRELADSIGVHGVLQPVLVRELSAGSYQLIAGERRWLAAQQSGLKEIPSRVLALEDREVCEVAIDENLKRKDLNVLEKAEAFRDYMERFDATVEELASRLSLDRSTVTNLLRLLDLPAAVQQFVRADKISGGHARAMLSLDEDQQVELCKRIAKESLSVRKTEAAVRAAAAEGKSNAPEKPPQPAPTQHVISLQDQLRNTLGVDVQIQLKSKESGRIVISFRSNDEFEQVFRNLRRAA